MFFGALGVAIGPVPASWNFDATGSYENAFTGLASMVDGGDRSGAGDLAAEASGGGVHL